MSRLSRKGQITTPRGVRAALHLEPGDLVACEVEGDKAILRRAEPLDAPYYKTVSKTLGEWNSADDDKAFRDL